MTQRESTVAGHIRLDAAQRGVLLYRNNCGVAVDPSGRHIRYGLCNDSPVLAKRVKSSDFIGITPVRVTADMIGQIIGVFTAVETKAPGWIYSDADERARAQAAFHAIIKQHGGFAGFARSVEEFRELIK